MNFQLVDQILELVPGQRIRTQKSLSLAEEYLEDHFPTFPVMPGVLMLECMAQSAAWLVRASESFTHSLYYLMTAKNVTFKSFVSPGRVLTIDVECKMLDESTSEFVGHGTCDGQQMVKAKITLGHANLADTKPSMRPVDEELIAHAKARFQLLTGEPSAFLAATS